MIKVNRTFGKVGFKLKKNISNVKKGEVIMSGFHRDDEENYRKQAMIAAKDLCYGNEVIEKIKAAKNDAEIERIMNTSRHEKR